MDALTLPVSQILRATRSIGIDASCRIAVEALRSTTGGVVPLVREEAFVGVITESGLRAALEKNAELDDPVEPFSEPGVTIPPYLTGAEALRRLEESKAVGAVVVDDGGVVWGVLYPSDLFPKPPPRIQPSVIGGMAAPYGVHLTAGVVSAGPGKWALVASGAYLGFILLIGRILAYGVGQLLLARGANQSFAENATNCLTLLFFAGLMRLSPISGYHAAEHQVVHAIERHENLVPAVVSRMSRIHPRCGTNLAAGFMIGTFFAFTDFGLPRDAAEFQPILGLILALAFWRRAGSFVQYWITTRPPSAKQLEAGIRSGKKLLAAYGELHNVRFRPWRSIWNAGMVQVAAGFILVGFPAAFLFQALNRLDVLSFGLGIL